MDKTCSKCGAVKPLGSFYAERNSPDGRRGDCKTCILAIRAERYASDPLMRERLIRAAMAKWHLSGPLTQPRSCRRCDAAMRPSCSGLPGFCVACKRVLGYKVVISREQRLAIYERDGWTCQICARPVDPDLGPQRRMAATLDHIAPRPLTLFPDDSPENLRLAHRSCNSARGNRAA